MLVADGIPHVGIGEIWAPVVSATIVAFLGLMGTYLTVRNNKDKAATSAIEAASAAQVAKDAATALQVKDSIIEGLEQRVTQLEETNERCEQRCSKLEERATRQQEQIEEMMEALRNASLLERELLKKSDSPAGSPPVSPESSSSPLPSPS